MSRPALHQLQPFNEHRFDDCLAYLSAKHGRALSLYDMVKLHVMIDAFHVVAHGKPVIGGQLAAFTNGPVSRPAKSRVTHWHQRYDQLGQMPDGFTVVEGRSGLTVRPTRVPDADDFSGAELAAMDRAWDAVVPTLDHSWDDSQEFFHRSSFIGRAWRTARHRGEALDWNEILKEYDREHGTRVELDIGRLLSC